MMLIKEVTMMLYTKMIRGILLLMMVPLYLVANEHKVLIHVSSSDTLVHAMALSQAESLKRKYGDKIRIEFIVNGPGLTMLTTNSKKASRIESLMMEDVVFDACATSMKWYRVTYGHPPKFLEDVRVVPLASDTIMRLEEAGYSYLKL